jgi:S-formylglutathione hydrolase
MSVVVKLIFGSKAFGCDILRFSHVSDQLGGLTTTWHAIVPAFEKNSVPTETLGPLPVLYYLSGLTCTDENFVQKAGAAQSAFAHRVAIIAPDTSPRGAGCPGEDDSWDFGTGAGFYVDATKPSFASHYRMYSYIRAELPVAVKAGLGDRVDTSRAAIFGHSMGGHGALVLALRNPDLFRSCSAFAPICHPSACPWGVKAFSGYLGQESSSKEAQWSAYDATELMKNRGRNNPLYKDSEILIDQGSEDSFLQQKQLLPEDFSEACKFAGQKVSLIKPALSFPCRDPVFNSDIFARSEATVLLVLLSC